MPVRIESGKPDGQECPSSIAARQLLLIVLARCCGRRSALFRQRHRRKKFGQRKRRFISPETIQQMARTLRDGEEVRFATDIDDYSGWTLARFQASENFDWKAREAKDWTTPWAGWPGTRYEAKAFREGRTPAYLTFVRKARC